MIHRYLWKDWDILFSYLTHIYIYIYIYIYIFTNLISSSIHGYQKKENKNPPGTRDKNISNHRPGEKEKKYIGQKERKDQPVTPVE